MAGESRTSWKKGLRNKGLCSPADRNKVDLIVVLRGFNKEDVPDFSEGCMAKE